MCVFAGKSFIIARVLKRVPLQDEFIKQVVVEVLNGRHKFCNCQTCRVVKEEVKKEPRLQKRRLRRRISTTYRQNIY